MGSEISASGLVSLWATTVVAEAVRIRPNREVFKAFMAITFVEWSARRLIERLMQKYAHKRP
ncbi:hypothetical protein D3C72_2527820 [compost metagenome]